MAIRFFLYVSQTGLRPIERKFTDLWQRCQQWL